MQTGLTSVRFAVVVLGALAASTGCGGNGGSSSTSPTPNPTSLSIQPGTDFLTVGSTETFTARLSLSDGSTQTVTATWSTDNPAVATVDAGRVTAVSPGEATIAANYQGSRASRRLRVAPDYEATWSGSYRIVGCSETGEWAAQRICNELDVVGESAPLQLRLVQQRTAVEGTLTLGTVTGTVTGTIAVAGTLEVQGVLAYQESGSTGTISLAEWNTWLEGSRMMGTYTQVWTAPGVSGELRLPCVLDSVLRAASTASSRGTPGRGSMASSVGDAARIRALLGLSF